MITAITITNFKKWKERKTIKIHPNRMSLLIGPNNCGKSTLLQALSLWNYCRMIVENSKGVEALHLPQKVCKGVGVNIEDFIPINIPSLDYLWPNRNFSGSYKLKIDVEWDEEKQYHLEFGLSLVQERLFIKVISTNVPKNVPIPRITMLTPFAGIEAHEELISPSIRRKMLGKGLPGAVLRNEILDFYNENIRKRQNLKGASKKLSKRQLDNLRSTDAFEHLQKIMQETFGVQLYVEYFNPLFHTCIHVNLKRGEMDGKRFKPFEGFNKRDILTEGSGFLQWLSVFTYALSPNIDVLLLDEPDAHLHPVLQKELFQCLNNISLNLKTQIIIATHSSEVVKNWNLNDLLCIDNNNIRYLYDEKTRVKAIHNLGADYHPILDKLKVSKKLFFVENDSDVTVLKFWASTLGLEWPEHLVTWPCTTDHSKRKLLFSLLKEQLDTLTCLSLRDKDRMSPNDIDSNLKLRGESDVNGGNYKFYPRCWQRHEIENYMLHPDAMARTVAKSRKEPYDENVHKTEVIEYLQQNHGITFNNDFKSKYRVAAIDVLFDKDGHQTIDEFCAHFHVKQLDIVKEMHEDEIFDDVKTLLNQIRTIFL